MHFGRSTRTASLLGLHNSFAASLCQHAASGHERYHSAGVFFLHEGEPSTALKIKHVLALGSAVRIGLCPWPDFSNLPPLCNRVGGDEPYQCRFTPYLCTRLLKVSNQNKRRPIIRMRVSSLMRRRCRLLHG